MKHNRKTFLILAIAMFVLCCVFITAESDTTPNPENDLIWIRKLLPPKGELRAVNAISHFEIKANSEWPEKVLKRVETSEIISNPLNTILPENGYNYVRDFEKKYKPKYHDTVEYSEVRAIRVIDSKGRTIRQYDLLFKEDVIPLRSDYSAKKWARNIFRKREENKYRLMRRVVVEAYISNNGKYFAINTCKLNWLKISDEEENELSDHTECVNEVFNLNGGRIQRFIRKRSIGGVYAQLVKDNGTVLFSMTDAPGVEKGYFAGEEKKTRVDYILFDRNGKEIYRSLKSDIEDSSKTGKILEFVESPNKIVFIDTMNRRKSVVLFDVQHLERRYDESKFDENKNTVKLRKEYNNKADTRTAPAAIDVDLFIPPCKPDPDGLKRCGVKVHIVSDAE